ncbi:hypothetical protein L3X38_003798 [Prunus dulcis]|uniref:Myb/SANT-like domain-containing protein n=1 Tax=Prunus dulcis TaxID=3755 RepID=A0AAD4ZMS9_PRUDU|nr:hypothetical protein L3X38_003798 [Prunus dulcis]
MSNNSGFAWNDVKKCIKVDSDDAWKTYVHHSKEAKRWRNKSFPIYDKLANIFGKDRATGKGYEVLVEMMEEQSHNEVNRSDLAAENESPMSQEVFVQKLLNDHARG